ncbi:MAG: hypothetical protein RSE91_02605, partial [Bacilli bacterium]
MFTPLNNTIKGVIEMTFPFVFISIVILISLRITYLIKTKTKFVIHKELFMLFFIIYVYVESRGWHDHQQQALLHVQ